MLFILTLALLPLGVVAILASVYSARENSQSRAEETLARLDAKAQILNDLVARNSDAIRAANAAISTAPQDRRLCDAVLRRLASLPTAVGRYALFSSGNAPTCSTDGFAPAPAAASDRSGTVLEISPDTQSLRLTVYGAEGALEGIVEFSREVLSRLTFIPGTRADFNLELVGNGRRMLLRSDYRRVPFVQTVSDSDPIGSGELELRIVLGAMPVRAIDVVIILLPVLMWFAAAIIGWWIVNRMLLRPLARFQRVVSSYQPGDRPLELPSLNSPAREIGELGEAFDNVTKTVARHEAELEAAVERQTRLVREVHHRVKNNLQVVASLLNLHSRGSANEEVAAAYASIQRRVDALAVVHRNHYAELEDNRGVALKPLISELAANLRATAPAAAAAMQIRLDIEPVHATQDTAVSVAFLVTEITEFGMLSGAGSIVIMLEAEGPGSARLTIEVDSLADGGSAANEMLSERFDRIITGLARQLRSSLDRDPGRGSYSVKLNVVDGKTDPTPPVRAGG